ncbi:MAG: hypothetical protein AAF657_35265 [Acidobacteriota bacterium]
MTTFVALALAWVQIACLNVETATPEPSDADPMTAEVTEKHLVLTLDDLDRQGLVIDRNEVTIRLVRNASPLGGIYMVVYLAHKLDGDLVLQSQTVAVEEGVQRPAVRLAGFARNYTPGFEQTLTEGYGVRRHNSVEIEDIPAPGEMCELYRKDELWGFRFVGRSDRHIYYLAMANMPQLDLTRFGALVREHILSVEQG